MSKTGFFILIIAISISFAAQQENPTNATRPGKVDMISFVTLEGNTIRARIVSEDKSQITVSYPQDGKFTTVSYGRDKFFPNSVTKQTVLEIDYWTELGDFFESQIWDFTNDPDDFVQAVRCFEKARDIAVSARGSSHELVKLYQQKIDGLNNQQLKWEETAKKRIEQIKLETQSNLQDKLNDINKLLDDTQLRLAVIEQGLAELKKTQRVVEDIKKQTENFEKITAQDIKNLNEATQTNSRQIDYLWRRVQDFGYGRYYYKN